MITPNQALMDTLPSSVVRALSTSASCLGWIRAQNSVLLYSTSPVDLHWEKLGCSTVFYPCPQRIKQSCRLSTSATRTMGQARRREVSIEVLYFRYYF